MQPRLACVYVVVAGLVMALSGRLDGATFTDLVVFGDSMSDTGNAWDFVAPEDKIPVPPYWQGRSSNGPVWVEHLASELGLRPPVASRFGGRNYAYGGAQTGAGTSTVYGSVPNVGQQIAEFLGGGGSLTENDLVVLWAGANDLSAKIAPSVIVSNLAEHIATLQANGARHLLVGNVYGPAELNTLLTAELERLSQELSLSIVRLDWVGLANEVLADPGAFGFTNASTPAFNAATGEVVPNPDEYAFWDQAYHPTAPFHQIIGQRAALAIKAVPEPYSLALATAACFLLLGL